MSTYATMQGWVKCPDKEDFQKLRDHLVAREFMDADGYWISGDKGGSPHANPDTLTFTLPQARYRNLCRVSLFEGNDARTGKIVGTSTDGCFVGWVDLPLEGAEEVSLKAYAGDPEPHPDKGLGAYCSWQDAAAANFHKTHAP